MDTNDKDSQQGKWPDEDHIVCVPDEDIQTIDRVIRNMEQAKQEFSRIRDSMKPLGDKETTSGGSQPESEQ